jgi:undecaprenyl-diphosphatase
MTKERAMAPSHETDDKSESAAPWEQPDEATQRAAEPIKQELEPAIAAINTPAKAEALVERLAQDTLGKTEAEESEKAQATHSDTASAEVQAAGAAEAVQQGVQAETGTKVDEAAAAIETIAREAVALEGPAYEALVAAVQEVTNPELTGDPEKLARPRRHLRDAIMEQMSFFQKYDTALFLAINNGPHSPPVNRFLGFLSAIFNGGWAWIIGTALFLPVRRRAATDLLKRITPPIWVAALVVEGPVKKYFRRKRPFIAVVQAIVVGKKPGNWSFPSGHAAAAFAGARMLHRCLPGWAWFWYPLAALIGFSRVYLGAHYPGDVFTGSLLGTALAEGTRWLMAKRGIAWEED